MKPIVSVLLLILSGAVTASGFGVSYYNCPSAETARSCSDCEKNAKIEVTFEVNTAQRAVSVTSSVKNKGTTTKRFKGCTVVSKTNWECIEESDFQSPNTPRFQLRTEWSAMNGQYFYESITWATGSKPSVTHACVK